MFAYCLVVFRRSRGRHNSSSKRPYTHDTRSRSSSKYAPVNSDCLLLTPGEYTRHLRQTDYDVTVTSSPRRAVSGMLEHRQTVSTAVLLRGPFKSGCSGIDEASPRRMGDIETVDAEIYEHRVLQPDVLPPSEN